MGERAFLLDQLHMGWGLEIQRGSSPKTGFSIYYFRMNVNQLSKVMTLFHVKSTSPPLMNCLHKNNYFRFFFPESWRIEDKNCVFKMTKAADGFPD